MENHEFENISGRNIEVEPYSSRIALMFFRHGQKEADPTKNDNEIELSQTGKEQALAKPHAANLDQAIAFGSSRQRSQETAAFAMAGDGDDITGTESFDELKEKINADLAVGSKIGIDDRLNFNLDPQTEFGKASYEAFNKKEYLKFLIEKSDEAAKAMGDKDSLTYSRGAASIGQIVEKYMEIAPRWDKLVHAENSSYSDTLERFLGSHQGSLEPFLAKVIELTEGKERRDEFVNALGREGFNFTEGFEADIINRDGKPQLHVSFRKEIDPEHVFEFEKDVPDGVLKKIITEIN